MLGPRDKLLHVGACLRATMPTTTSAAPITLRALSGSLNNATPSTTVPNAPIPVHTAYALRTGNTVGTLHGKNTKAASKAMQIAVHPKREYPWHEGTSFFVGGSMKEQAPLNVGYIA